MRLFLLLFAVLNFSVDAWGYVDVCDYINLPGCSGVSRQGRRSSNQSSPSPVSAATSNPANASMDKGLGIEGMYQENNPIGVSILTGTGNFGGSFLSPNLENSFFGNRVPEIDERLLDRQRSKSRYRNKKANFAFARKIIDNKKFTFDIGLSVKRSPDIGDINLGVGASASFSIFNIAYAGYYDDINFSFEDYINPYQGRRYKDIYGREDYFEKFFVRAFSVGFKAGRFSFDFGDIRCHYDLYRRANKTNIYSTALNLGKVRLNYAFRKEHSDRFAYVGDTVIERRVKSDAFYGAQWAIFKNAIIGINYNYFLLHDFSFTLALFL